MIYRNSLAEIEQAINAQNKRARHNGHCAQRRKSRMSRESRAYDDNHVIELTYNGEFYHQAPTTPSEETGESAAAASYSFSAFDWPQSSLDYSVESFEEEADETENDSADARGESALLTSADGEESAGELDSAEAETQPEQASQETELARAADVAAFEADLRSMIAEKKEEKIQEVVRQANDGDEPPEPATRSIHSHKFFDNLAEKMSLATTYDVGTVKVDDLFREFDQNLERNQGKRKTLAPSRPLTASDTSDRASAEFSDLDLARDLEIISASAAKFPVTPHDYFTASMPGVPTSSAIALAQPIATALSGANWVAKFPGSKDINDLELTFRTKVQQFIGAMEGAGAHVKIESTYRPPERAYLMHWSWLIAKQDQDAQMVPPMTGVAINWWHGDAAQSRQAAQAMVDGYGTNDRDIAPSLTSRHIERKAVDMDISWAGDLNIKQADGSVLKITSTPRDGTNADLIAVGKGYGVIHLIDVNKDKPHWSTDGR